MSTAIGVAIGLILMYLILSLVASAIQESISTLFAKRSKELEKGIETLLGDALKARFYDHGLIKSLSNPTALLHKVPSYISAKTFSTVVLDLVAEKGRNSAPAAADNPPQDTVPTVLQGLESTEAGDGVSAALKVFAREEQTLAGLKKRLEGWFDEAMDRVSGWYKRWTKLMLFGIGLALAVLLNADTLNVAKTLWTDPAARAAAEQLAAQEAQQSDAAEINPKEDLVKFEALNLPLGWVAASDRVDPRHFPNDPKELFVKLLGLLITAIALTFGAPFWFDMLKKFVDLRSSGPAPATSTGGAATAAPASD